MTTHHDNLTSPVNRKCCKSCAKRIYLHQPILYCPDCNNIFHGKCLNLNNDKIHVLQQISWKCSECCIKYNHTISCCNCNLQLNLSLHKFNLCKICYRIYHNHCLFKSKCVDCIPNFSPVAGSNSSIEMTVLNQSNMCDSYFNDLPYFSPFQYIDRPCSILPEPDELSEQLQHTTQILQTCNYYNTQQFSDIISNNNGSIFIGWNIDGLRSNFDKFRLFVNNISTSTTIAGYILCETNVTEFESLPFYLVGYNRFILDRIKISENKYKHKGSGLMILLNDNINNASIDTELSLCTPDSEFLVVKFHRHSNNVFIVGVYRPPSGNFQNFIDNFDNLMVNINKVSNNSCHLLGDFNLNLYNPASNNVNAYLDCLFSNGLFPLISRATHFKGINPTCIDHILTNNISDTVLSGIITSNISHHMPCFSIFKTRNIQDKSNSINNPRPIINEYTLTGFSNDVKTLKTEYESVKLDSSDSKNSLSASEIFSNFLASFTSIYNKWFIQTRNSRKHRRSSIRKDWMTIGLAKSSGTKDTLYATWCDNKTNVNKVAYYNYKRKFDSLIAKAKYSFYENEFKACRTDLKKTWKTINTILGRKRRNKLLVFNNDDAAHNFNKYFTSIAGNLIEQKCPQTPHSFTKYLGPKNNKILTDFDFSCSDLEFFISKLDNNKSTYFSPKVVKAVSHDLSLILTNMFNLCYKEGTFPNDLKIAKVVPIFKNSGSIKDIGNYRPISMLSLFSKLFEKLIHKRMLDFLLENNLINPSQYGFRPGHSTLHALINATENIYQSLDINLHTLGIFIDFSKAFDTVSHDILLYKLRHYGIDGKLLNIIQSYLTNRYQYVSYGGTNSTSIEIKLGVPQGSVLGPLLFLIFINDITNTSEIVKFVLFADDSNMFVSHSDRYTLYSLANEALYSLFEYCSANKIVINYKKCCFVEFGTAKSDDVQYNLSILDNVFERVNECKFLGVFINSNLDWTSQLKHVKNQVAKATGSLNSVRKIVPSKILRNIYFALVQPYMVYCIPLWGSNHNCKDFVNIFIGQKKAVRVLSNRTYKINHRFVNTKPLFARHNILTIHNLYFYLLSTETYKILNNKSPSEIFNSFTLSNRSIRLIIPKFQKTIIAKKCFSYTASRIMNYLLQNDIFYVGYALSSFKSKLKRYLMTKQSLCLNRDINWLPCNINIYSDVTVGI